MPGAKRVRKEVASEDPAKRTRRLVPADCPPAPSEEKKASPMPMPDPVPLSEQQASLVQDVVARHNVLGIAKAGAGKSSVSLACAKRTWEVHRSKSLIITFNTRLKEESRARVQSLGYAHFVEAHSYHAAAHRFFVPHHQGGANDSLIDAALRVSPVRVLDFSLVVVDEAQDMNPLLARFVAHLLSHSASPPTLLIVGDPFQRIFGFSGATCDYMLEPERHFGRFLHEQQQPFRVHHLSISWRITHEMAAWINQNLNPCALQHTSHPAWWAKHGEKIMAWWGYGIQANPARRPCPGSVRVYRGWGSREAAKHLKAMYQTYGDAGVALLSHSLGGKKSPVQALVNRLGVSNHENWIVLNASASQPSDLFQGKRIASTIHRFKGLERDGVVVCGVDAFIESRYTENPLDHYNVWYVACTRAKQELVINIAGQPYATLRKTRVWCGVGGGANRTACTVNSLTRYVPFDDVLSVSRRFVDTRAVRVLTGRAVPVPPGLVAGRLPGTVESLRPFFNQAVTTHLMWRIHRRVPVIHFSSLQDQTYFDADMIEWVTAFAANPSGEWTDVLKHSIASYTRLTRYKHCWRQLIDLREQHIPVAFLQRCSDNAFDLVKSQAREQNDEGLRRCVRFHIPVSINLTMDWFTRRCMNPIRGFVDLYVNQNRIVTLQVGDQVKAETLLQTQLYGSITSHPTFLLWANRGELQELRLTLDAFSPSRNFDFILRAIRRKLHLPVTEHDMKSDFHCFQAKNPNFYQIQKPSNS